MNLMLQNTKSNLVLWWASPEVCNKDNVSNVILHEINQKEEEINELIEERT